MKKKVIGRISFSIEGPAKIEKEENWYVATFIPLDVCSQGKTMKEAKKRLLEAVALYIDALFRMGTLEEVLIESGYRKSKSFDEMWKDFEVPTKKQNIVKEWDMKVPVPLLLGMATEQTINA